LKQYLNEQEIEAFNSGETGIYSITVFAQKVGGKKKQVTMIGSDEAASCEPGSGCC